METSKVHYCFTLSEEQMKYLRSKKYKIDRMECFMSLVSMAVREKKLVQLSKTQQVEILAGQFMVDNTQLAKLWGKDRKTVPKLLEAMASLGIFSSQKVVENRIYTLHSLIAWYVDGQIVSNDFALKRKQDGSGVFHADVPHARVFVIEDEETVKMGEESTAFTLDKSKCGIVGKVAPDNDAVAAETPQSIDSAAVGKYGDIGKPSEGQSEKTSPQTSDVHNSAGYPSST